MYQGPKWKPGKGGQLSLASLICITDLMPSGFHFHFRHFCFGNPTSTATIPPSLPHSLFVPSCPSWFCAWDSKNTFASALQSQQWKRLQSVHSQAASLHMLLCCKGVHTPQQHLFQWWYLSLSNFQGRKKSLTGLNPKSAHHCWCPGVMCLLSSVCILP